MKRTPLIIGGVVAAAALWSGGWYAGKVFFVEPQADKAVEDLRSGSLFFSFDQRVIGGFPFGYDVSYENPAISDASTMWRWTAPWMRIESGVTDVGALTVTAAETSLLTVEPELFGATGATVPILFDVVSDSFVATLSGDQTASEIELSAGSVTLTQKGGANIISDGSAAVTDFSADIRMEPGAGVYVGAASIAKLTNSYRFSADGVNETTTTSEVADISLDFETRAFSGGNIGPLLQENGLIRVTFETGAYLGVGATSGGPSAPPVNVTYKGGEAEAVVDVSDGRARYAGDVEDIDVNIVIDAPGPFGNPAFTLDEVAFAMEMPLIQSEGVQPYAMSLAVEDLSLAPSLWSAFDPTGALDQDDMQFEMELTGDARVLTDFSTPGFGQAPIDLETMLVDKLTLDALGVEAKGSGRFEIAGDASRSDGVIEIEAEGVLALLEDLANAGLIPPPALGAYQGLIAQFTVQDGDDDRLTTRIESRNGAVSINGQFVSQQ